MRGERRRGGTADSDRPLPTRSDGHTGDVGPPRGARGRRAPGDQCRADQCRPTSGARSGLEGALLGIQRDPCHRAHHRRSRRAVACHHDARPPVAQTEPLLRHVRHPGHRVDRRPGAASPRRLPAGRHQPDWGGAAAALHRTGPGACLNIHTPAELQLDWRRRQRPGYLITFASNLRLLSEHCRQSGEATPPVQGISAAVTNSLARREADVYSIVSPSAGCGGAAALGAPRRARMR
jgi:hypothetical protein